jgi:predicted RNA binding protein YcfA (HicA-like mRNA interferase family)
MSRLPHLSGKQIIKALSNAGFRQVRQKGSHVILVRFENGVKRGVVVPLHWKVDVGTLLEIMRQAGLKRADFLKLL